MKFRFEEKYDKDVRTLAFPDGYFQTSSYGGIMKYEFDRSDNTVQLTIDDDYFTASDVTELIDLLTAVKNKLEN